MEDLNICSGFVRNLPPDTVINEIDDDTMSISWKNFNTNLSEGLEDMFSQAQYADCEFVVEGETIRAHRAVVTAASPLLDDVFRNRTNKLSIELRNIKASVFKSLLEYMYSGKITVAKNDMKAFNKAAGVFRMNLPPKIKTHRHTKKSQRKPCTMLAELMESRLSLKSSESVTLDMAQPQTQMPQGVESNAANTGACVGKPPANIKTGAIPRNKLQ